MAKSEKKIYPKWKAEAKAGRLYIDRQDEFNEHLIPLEGKELVVIVKPKTKNRSRQEEKYYHAVVVRMVAEAMSITDQEAHEFLKKLFLTIEESIKHKNKTIRYERTQSTTELTDSAYREYWNKCVSWASLPTDERGLSQSSGLEIYIPLPREIVLEYW